MVAHSPPRILVVTDSMPEEAVGLSPLFARSDYRFVFANMHVAVDKLSDHEFAAAILLTPPAYLHGRQKELIHVLDELVQRQIGTMMLACRREDLAMAERMCNAGGGDGLMAVPLACNPDELAGRLAGLAAARPIIDQLQRENQLLRRFENGVNNQMTQIDEEMRLAARLQVDFLPRSLPDTDRVSFDVIFRPASYVSGDIYDACRLDEDHIGFFVADAVGHGMPAALLTIFLKRALQTKEIIKTGYRLVPPGEALARLNNDLVAQQLSMCQFVTMIYGILNTRTLSFQWARAGHPLPLLLKSSGAAEELELDGALLGVFPDEAFPLQTLQLHPGDSILMYSDGFESAFSDSSGAINDRYRHEFAKLAGPQPKTRFALLAGELDKQEGSLHQRDDVTALLMSIKTEPVA